MGTGLPVALGAKIAAPEKQLYYIPEMDLLDLIYQKLIRLSDAE